MPDPSALRNAAEAALFTEYRDTVLCYARLCARDPASAEELTREALGRGLREIRARPPGPASRPSRPARRVPRLPARPLLLTAVRTTAAAWEAGGRGHRLDPGLRAWLRSAPAARHTGPPLLRPLALRALRDMQEADADLLWLTDVECLPAAVVARRLRLDPAALAEELTEVRGLFRDRCRRAHLDRPMDGECRSYARLLDAVHRGPAAESPAGLTAHLDRCTPCAEAAACLRPHGAALPAALADGVIGWGGAAYLALRRHAAEAPPGPAHPDGGGPEAAEAGRARVLRGGLVVAAVLVSLLALAVTLVPRHGSGGRDGPAHGEAAARRPVADASTRRGAPIPPSGRTRPTAPSTPQAPHAASTAPTAPGGAAAAARDRAASPGAAPSAGVPLPSRPAASTTRAAPAPPAVRVPGPGRTTGSAAPATGGPPSCRVAYRPAGEWPGGFQATVTVTTGGALDDWTLTWAFRDGQRVTRAWGARLTQHGARVTARAPDHHRAVPAPGTLSFGFLGSWSGRNTPPHGFALDGRACADR